MNPLAKRKTDTDNPRQVREAAIALARKAVRRVARLREHGPLACVEYRNVPESALLAIAANWCGLAKDFLLAQAAQAGDREEEGEADAN